MVRPASIIQLKGMAGVGLLSSRACWWLELPEAASQPMQDVPAVPLNRRNAHIVDDNITPYREGLAFGKCD